MRYLVDITQKQSDEITRLINEGKYQSVAKFITTAVENQIYIETSGELPQHVEVEKKEPDISSTKPYIMFDSETKKIALTEITNQPQTVSMPQFSDLSASLYKAEEEKCWLWGQTNRIFPIKIGVRVLYAILDSEKWIALEEYREKAADIAAVFGALIRKYEDKKNKMREEKISAGLPVEKEFKSKARYKGHFLAYMRKDNKIEGAMPFLRFANLMKDEKGKIFIGLTDAGLNFAKLENPVIDNSGFDKNFSEKEISFYLKHILQNVKGEAGAIKWLLNKIADGLIERKELNKAIKNEFARIWDNVSDAVINTQRAGLMARMFELGLIKKEKTGIKVSYGVADQGRIFLKNMT